MSQMIKDEHFTANVCKELIIQNHNKKIVQIFQNNITKNKTDKKLGEELMPKNV
jgi:hypothetical protein